MRSASIWGSCGGLGGAGRLGAAPAGAYTAAVQGAALGHLASPPATRPLCAHWGHRQEGVKTTHCPGHCEAEEEARRRAQ